MSDYRKIKDAELVRMTLDGDGDAYGELVHRYQGTVYSIAYRMVRRHDIAEDIAQDAFVDGFIGLSRLSDPEKFAPWIFGFSKRKALHHLSRAPIYADLDEVADFILSDAPTPEECSIQKERALAVQNALSRLSDKNRTVAILFYFDGKSIAEIASILSLPVGTVKSRLYEARAKLKGELADMDMEERTNMPSPDFVKTVREKIQKLALYYRQNGLDEGYQKMYDAAERYISNQPDSKTKYSALAELYQEKYNHSKDGELKSKLFRAAEAGEDGDLLYELYEDDILNRGNNYEEWLTVLDEEALPKLRQLHNDAGMGRLHFWRGAANSCLSRLEEAHSDFVKAEQYLSRTPRDIYHTLAVSAQKVYHKMTQNADDPLAGFYVTAESYRKDRSKMCFGCQPGFGVSSVMYEKHRMDYINYFVSRCNNIFFDTAMAEGETLTDKDGSSTLTVISYGEPISVAAGHFERSMHLFYSEPAAYDAHIWYAEGVGLLKVIFSNGYIPEGEIYELYEVEIKGGDGYFPLAVGNRWCYRMPDLPGFFYQCFENEVIWSDGITANVSTIHLVSFKKGFAAEEEAGSDYYISKCEKACESDQPEEAIGYLQRAVQENSNQNAALAALGGIEYLTRYLEGKKKGYRFCPSSYNASYLIGTDGKVRYLESGAYSFGPYRWGSRFEENRIYGVKPFRYLQGTLNRIWDEKWVPGYSEQVKTDFWDVHLEVSDGGAISVPCGSFAESVKVTLRVDENSMKPGDYFYNHTTAGIKEFWFVRGVGIVRFDYTWGEVLRSSSVLSKYENPAGVDSFLPLSLGCGWEYDEVNLTGEGYCAKRIVKVACGRDEKYMIHDMQEFHYKGTEEEYEAFKQRLKAEGDRP